MIIRKCAFFDSYIALVLHDDFVVDRFAYSYAFCRFCFLCDAKLSLCRFCCYCCCCLSFCRVFTSLRCCISLDCIDNLTCIDVSLSHRICVLKLCCFGRCECECLISQVCMIIDQLAVLDAYIALVLNDNFVVDCVAYSYALCRICFLCDAQLSCCFLCCYCCSCRNFLRIFASLRCCISLYYVNDFSSIHICLCHFICISELCCLSRCKCECLISQVCMVIDQLTGLDAYIALVLNGNFVVDRVAYCYAFCRFCFLCDAQLSLCRFCCNCCCCCDFCRVFTSFSCCVCFDYVHDRACIDICLCNFVCISELCCLSRCQCECLSRQICMIIHEFARFDAYIALVLHDDFVVDRVAYSYAFCRFCFLCDAQLSCCCLCSNCVFSIITDIFSARVFSCCCYRIYDLACIDIFLQHFVCCCCCCFLIRCNRCHIKIAKLDSFKDVIKLKITDCNIAIVLNLNSISDLIAKFYSAIIRSF